MSLMGFKRDAAIRYAQSFIGVRYYWSDGTHQQAGNDDPVLGFDCSGLISEVLRGVGLLGGRERLSAYGL